MGRQRVRSGIVEREYREGTQTPWRQLMTIAAKRRKNTARARKAWVQIRHLNKPGGAIELSPALQRWVGYVTGTSPRGTTHALPDILQPSKSPTRPITLPEVYVFL